MTGGYFRIITDQAGWLLFHIVYLLVSTRCYTEIFCYYYPISSSSGESPASSLLLCSRMLRISFACIIHVSSSKSMLSMRRAMSLGVACGLWGVLTLCSTNLGQLSTVWVGSSTAPVRQYPHRGNLDFLILWMYCWNFPWPVSTCVRWYVNVPCFLASQLSTFGINRRVQQPLVFVVELHWVCHSVIVWALISLYFSLRVLGRASSAGRGELVAPVVEGKEVDCVVLRDSTV